MSTEPKKTTRVQMELSPSSMQRLEALKQQSDASSYAEVMKNALKLYEIMIKRVDAGEQLIAIAPDGTQTEIIVLL